jgi:hypothetical protein
LKQLTTITSWLVREQQQVRQVQQQVRHQQAFAQQQQALQQERERVQQLLLFFHTQQRQAPKSWLQVVTSAF